jgi:hypothetical protein
MKINNVEYVIGETKEFEHKGAKRKSIKCRLPKGKNLFYITQYEDGSYSLPTRTSFKASF